MSSAQVWVCANCRSVNQARAGRCYSCRAPRAFELDLRSTAAPTRVTDQAPSEVQARVARQAGATYQSSARRATIVKVTVLVVAITSLAATAVPSVLLAQLSSPSQNVAPGVLGGAFALLGAEVVAWVIGWIAWGAWLSRVVANVPALGGGWPRTSPPAAFATSVIPFYNLYGATSVLRDVLVRLSPSGSARLGLLSAWWIALFVAIMPSIGIIPGPLFVLRVVFEAVATVVQVGLLALTGSEFNVVVIAQVIGSALLIVAAALAVGLVDHVESLQDARAHLPAAAIDRGG